MYYWIICIDEHNQRIPLGSWDNLQALNQLLNNPFYHNCWFLVTTNHWPLRSCIK